MYIHVIRKAGVVKVVRPGFLVSGSAASGELSRLAAPFLAFSSFNTQHNHFESVPATREEVIKNDRNTPSKHGRLWSAAQANDESAHVGGPDGNNLK